MLTLTTLHVILGDARSSILAAGYNDALNLAVDGERCGIFRAERITDWLGGSMECDALRQEIELRRPQS